MAVTNKGGWIGVDLDGTLAIHDFRPSDPTHIGQPVPLMVKRVREWLAQGVDVRVMTARVGSGTPDDKFKQRVAIKEWTFKNVGTALECTACKDYAMIELWDDRAVAVEHNTGRRLSNP